MSRHCDKEEFIEAVKNKDAEFLWSAYEDLLKEITELELKLFEFNKHADWCLAEVQYRMGAISNQQFGDCTCGFERRRSS